MRNVLIILLAVLLTLMTPLACAAGGITEKDEETGYSLVIQDDAGLLDSAELAQVQEAMRPILEYANVGFLTRPSGDSMSGSSASKAMNWGYDAFGNTRFTVFIIDMNTRRLLRREHLEDQLPLDTICPENAIETPCGKVQMPEGEIEQVAEHKVSYSDIDFVGHTNNARYVVWAMDSIDQEFASTHQVSEVAVNFNRETRLGDKSYDVFIYYVGKQEEDYGRIEKSLLEILDDMASR